MNKIIPLFIVFILTGFMASCDETFEPLKENDRYFFSMFGYLDATVDTQWVRIIPLREGVHMQPETLEAKVTLHHLETGEQVVMNDSLFRFAGDAAAWNFRTTMDLLPEQTYMIKAEDVNGNISSVSVTMPEEFPTPMISTMVSQDLKSLDRFTVTIKDVENLADVRTIWQVQQVNSPNTLRFNFPHLQDSLVVHDGLYSMRIDPMEDMIRIARHFNSDFEKAISQFYVTHRQIFIASAGQEWLFFPEIDEMIYALPDGVTNVDNGLGYVVGVVSKTIPFRNCYDENGNLTPCEIEKPRW